MNLKDLLLGKAIDPQRVLVLRHRPVEPELNKWLPWLAAEKPHVFNAYQQTQTTQVEGEMTRAEYVAAFIGHAAGKALFVGLFSINGSRAITPRQYWKIPANVELKAYGHNGFTDDSPRPSILWFDLALTDFYADWKGKLVVRWPPLDKNWHRWAHRPKNEMSVLSILEESALNAPMPKWDEIERGWEQLADLPASWRAAMSQWRGIYYIFDTSDKKGYVGSAYGEFNILGRWQNYAASGHGGNRLLRQRDPKNFRFTILELVPPNMPKDDVIRRESSWKHRLHTQAPDGLNDN